LAVRLCWVISNVFAKDSWFFLAFAISSSCALTSLAISSSKFSFKVFYKDLLLSGGGNLSSLASCQSIIKKKPFEFVAKSHPQQLVGRGSVES
jgi:hypothetical protein